MKLINRHETPVMIQLEATECGAVCLGIILAHYGRHVPLEDLRIECDVMRDGSKASRLIAAARAHQMKAYGAKIPRLEDFKNIRLPAILHWSFNHFVVLEKFTKKEVFINDPALGHVTMTHKDFDENFTGVALILEPSEKFVKNKKPAGLFVFLAKQMPLTLKDGAFLLSGVIALLVLGIIIPGFSKIFVDSILIHKESSWLKPLLLGMLLTGALRYLFSWLQGRYLTQVTLHIAFGLPASLMRKLLSLPMTFFEQRETGDVVERLLASSKIADLFTWDFSTTVFSLLTMVFFAFLLIMLSFDLFLVVLFFLLLKMLILVNITRKSLSGTQKWMQSSIKLFAFKMSLLSSVETIKTIGSERFYFQKFLSRYFDSSNQEQSIILSQQDMLVIHAFLSLVSGVSVLLLGGMEIINAHLSVGSLVAFQSLAASFETPVNALMQLGSKISIFRSSVWRFKDTMHYPNEEDKRTQESTAVETISVQNMSFGYQKTGEPLLKNITLSFRQGERIALVGRSGSGKSSLMKLLCGLYAPQKGQILFNDAPLDTLTRKYLANQMAFVEQKTALIDGSILDNLKFYDTYLDEERAERALADACLFETLQERGGLQAEVKHGGNNFSGGECKRIEIARALAQEPAFLILDEATAELDSLTEMQVLENIKNRNILTLIVSHRLSAIRDCDQIIVLENGEIQAQGTHAHLMEVSPLYNELMHMGESA